MTNKDLFNLFDNCKYSSSDSIYDVCSIPDMHHKLSKSDKGYPRFFVLTKKDKSSPHNTIGEYLSVEYNVDCYLNVDGVNVSNSNYTIITLCSTDRLLQQIFIEFFIMALFLLPAIPDAYELALKIEGLLSIFSSLKKKPIKELQGLWAELLVIERSKRPEIIARAWHDAPSAKFDFTMGEDKIEVKSASGEVREHSFSLDQLNPSENSNLIVASTFVRESAKAMNGLSVFDIYDKLCERILDVQVRMHIYSVITKTVGCDYDKAQTTYFDYVEAVDNLKFYDYEDIPKIDKYTVPKSVSSVKFISDLTSIDDVLNKNYNKGNSELYNALF